MGLALRYGLYELVLRDWVKYWCCDFQKLEIDNGLLHHMNGSIYNAMPLLLCDRLWRVLYVSNSYRALTSWNKQLPTGAFSLFQEMSPQSVREFFHVATLYFISHFDRQTDTNWFMVNASLRDYAQDCFMDGTLHLTTKFDQYSVPLLFVLTFLPKTIQSTICLSDTQ